MSADELSVPEICQLLNKDADAIARKFLPHGKYVNNGREWRCSGRNSPTGSVICVHVAPGIKQGSCGFWNESESGGDLLDLYQAVHGVTKRESVQWALKWLGLSSGPTLTGAALVKKREEIERLRARRDKEAAQDIARIRAYAVQIWNASDPFGGLGAVYFEWRGLDPKDGESLRVHPGLKHPSGGVFPAIIGKVIGPDGKGVGIWRIYLKPTGEGKAPVDNPKLGLGECIGGAVRLGGMWTEIGVSEGIETGAACRQLIRRWTNKEVPVWPALSSSGMAGLILPPEVKVLRIFADNDPIKYRNDKVKPSAGLDAAQTLAKRAKAQGVEVHIHAPPVSMDWDNVLAKTKEVARSA